MQQTADTHTLTYRDTHTLCQGHTVPGSIVCQLQGHKERQRRKSRTKKERERESVCVWPRDEHDKGNK